MIRPSAVDCKHWTAASQSRASGRIQNETPTRTAEIDDPAGPAIHSVATPPKAPWADEVASLRADIEALRAETAELERQLAEATEVDTARLAEESLVPVRGGVELIRYEIVWVY